MSTTLWNKIPLIHWGTRVIGTTNWVNNSLMFCVLIRLCLQEVDINPTSNWSLHNNWYTVTATIQVISVSVSFLFYLCVGLTNGGGGYIDLLFPKMVTGVCNFVALDDVTGPSSSDLMRLLGHHTHNLLWKAICQLNLLSHYCLLLVRWVELS